MSPGREKISVIIPVYNRPDAFQACAETILTSGYEPLELILVDDASTDETPQRLREFQNGRSDRVKLVLLSENRGPAGARNAGARAATADYLLFVDSDTRLMPGSIEKFLERMHEADAVSGIYHHEPLNPGIAQRYKAYLLYSIFSRAGRGVYEAFTGFVGGIRREVFFELGGFNDSLAWGQDYEGEEFGRLINTRHTLVLEPDMQVRHEFPGFMQTTRDYFNRTAKWLEFFMHHRRFESRGTATGVGGAATLAGAALPVLIWSPLLHVLWTPLPLAVLVVYLAGYGRFFAFVARERPLFLPAAIVLNLYYNAVISAGALRGLLAYLMNRKPMNYRTGLVS